MIFCVYIDGPGRCAQLLSRDDNRRGADLDRVVIGRIGIADRRAEAETVVGTNVDIGLETLRSRRRGVRDEAEGALQAELLLDIVPFCVKRADVELECSAEKAVLHPDLVAVGAIGLVYCRIADTQGLRFGIANVGKCLVHAAGAVAARKARIIKRIGRRLEGQSDLRQEGVFLERSHRSR